MESLKNDNFAEEKSEISAYIRDYLLKWISGFSFKENFEENLNYLQSNDNKNFIPTIQKEIESFKFVQLVKDKYPLNLIKTLMQHGGALCGFHCLFNSICYIHFLKNQDDPVKQFYYLQKMNSVQKFWKFYKHSLTFLLESENVYETDKKSLKNSGPLERYQFDLLLNKKDDIVKKIASDEKNEIKFFSYFYAFNFIQSLSKEDIIKLQESLNYFKTYRGDKKLIYVILLGITNHWSVLLLENDNEKITFNYLDSTNINVFMLKTVDDVNENLSFLTGNSSSSITELENMNKEIEKFADRSIAEISVYRPFSNAWFRKCYIQWMSDINITIKYFFKILFEDFTLYHVVVEGGLIRLAATFEEYVGINLSEDAFIEKNEEKIFEIKEKLLLWLNVEYHPTTIHDDILNPISKFKFTEEVKKLKCYLKIFNWLNFCKKIQSSIHNKNWLHEEKDIEERERDELIDRFYEILNELEILI